MRRIYNSARLLTAICIAGLLANCAGNHQNVEDQDPLAPRQVSTLIVERHGIPGTENLVATVVADREAEIAAQIQGPIEEMMVELGDKVEKGALLIRVNESEIRARLAQAKAQLAQATSDLTREQALFQDGASTEARFEQAQTRAEVAAEAVREVETRLGYATIRAPFNGIITRQLAEPGDLATPGKPLLLLADPTDLQAEVEIPEALIFDLSMGQSLKVHVDAPDLSITGSIAEIAPAADPQARTFRVKLDLPDHERLRTGQFARVSVPVERRQDVITVPSDAIGRFGQVEQVFVVEKKDQALHARRRIIKTGARFGDVVEVLSGLREGERIVAEGVHGLRDGQGVETREAEL